VKVEAVNRLPETILATCAHSMRVDDGCLLDRNRGGGVAGWAPGAAGSNLG
jgi:hypothetical protein